MIEVLSKGYEKKDLELGPPFYFKHGVRDVVVYDPLTKATRPFTTNGEQTYEASITLSLQCGCQVTL